MIELDTPVNRNRYSHEWAYLAHNDSLAIETVARDLAKERGFPQAMAGVNRGIREKALEDLNINNSSDNYRT